MKQDPHGTQEPQPVMTTCAECGRPTPWNPVGYCSWECFDSRPRDAEAAAHALAYFLNLVPPARRHHRNP
ncbi:hypothetical protein ACFRKE_19495 [Kitasatospora indigofera]|uniref:hypothetical protein n=1 Tax=Kitasatospora indigofera TaxID=67307 RepID=UPI00363362C7